MSDRRTFLKTAGLMTAGAALFNPASLFARNSAAKKKSGSKKLELAWEDFQGIMKFTFTMPGKTSKAS